MTKRRVFLSLSMLLGLAVCTGQSASVRGQVLNAGNETGVRHAIIGTVEAAHDTAVPKRDGEASNATVDILVRVLDYAIDSRFFGVVDGKFSDFDPSKGAEAQQIWADGKCHQNRGFPRLWVLAVNGKITQGEKVFEVAAQPRHVGEHAPKDEVVTQKDPEVSDPNQNLVTLARTTESGFRIHLTLKTTKCRLRGD